MNDDKPVVLTKKDFESGQDVRWCPGCGDFAVLARVQRVLAELGLPREDHVFVAGIGCSSRFPYYMGTYGLHTIHGRAPAFATGVRLANANLKVWIVTGDGDALSIGTNHFVHLCRRNVDATLLLLNNGIYGLTKGQYSPTSPAGTVSKSSPGGSVERPLRPLAVALAAGVSFAARATDRDLKSLDGLLAAAAAHRGTAVIEILQNCVVHNDGAYELYTDPKTRHDHVVQLTAGQPLRFGSGGERTLTLDLCDLRADGRGLPFVHDPRNQAMAKLLADLDAPLPLGVLYQEERGVFEAQMKGAGVPMAGVAQVQQLLQSGETWVV